MIMMGFQVDRRIYIRYMIYETSINWTPDGSRCQISNWASCWPWHHPRHQGPWHHVDRIGFPTKGGWTKKMRCRKTSTNLCFRKCQPYFSTMNWLERLYQKKGRKISKKKKHHLLQKMTTKKKAKTFKKNTVFVGSRDTQGQKLGLKFRRIFFFERGWIIPKIIHPGERTNVDPFKRDNLSIGNASEPFWTNPLIFSGFDVSFPGSTWKSVQCFECAKAMSIRDGEAQEIRASIPNIHRKRGLGYLYESGTQRICKIKSHEAACYILYHSSAIHDMVGTPPKIAPIHTWP